MDDRRTIPGKGEGKEPSISAMKKKGRTREERARDQQIVKLLTAKVIRATMLADIRLCVASRNCERQFARFVKMKFFYDAKARS